jgi:hypothetical protein
MAFDRAVARKFPGIVLKIDLRAMLRSATPTIVSGFGRV